MSVVHGTSSAHLSRVRASSIFRTLACASAVIAATLSGGCGSSSNDGLNGSGAPSTTGQGASGNGGLGGSSGASATGNGATSGASGNSNAGTNGTSGATNGGSSAAGTSGSSGAPSGNGGGSGGPTVAACNGLPFAPGASDAGSCVGVTYEAEALPVDMYVLMDRSSSMAEVPTGGTLSRWEQVRSAVEQ